MERRFSWLGITLAWLLWAVINVVRLHAQVPNLSWERAAWYGLPDALIWALLAPFVFLLVRRLDAAGWDLPKALPAHVIAAVGVALLHSTADAGIAALRNLANGSLPHYGAILGKVLTHTLQLNLLMYFLVAGLAYYLRNARRLANRERRTAELRAQLTKAQLTSLESQLRPHFLFNALHTVSSLLESEPRRAQRVIRQLGDLLRASLKSRSTQTVPLAEELELVRAYLDVEKARFEDRLTIDIQLEDIVAKAHVPALLLQPIVENAVRHGVSRNVAGGRVGISALRRGDSLLLRVEDDGPGMSEQAGASKGVGLANTRARLRALYEDRYGFSIEPGDPRGVYVTIDIPWSEPPAL